MRTPGELFWGVIDTMVNLWWEISPPRPHARIARPADRSRLAGRRDPLGPRGERAAARFLRREGCRIVGRNVRLRAGEIDLLALDSDGRTLIIVEVKTRRIAAPPISGPAPLRPPPEHSITAHKRGKLLALAAGVSSRPRWRDYAVRIDVVAVEWPLKGAPVIRRHINAVTR